MHNIAAVLSGGRGLRLGNKMPKQFISIGGKSLVEYTLEAFQKHPLIHEIIVVVDEQYNELVKKIKQKNNFNKLTKIVPCGTERYESSWSAIKSCHNFDANILIHDAVRPLVSNGVIDRVINKLNKHNAVCPVIAAEDTILQCSKGVVEQIPDRNNLFYAQTPQGFKLSVIKKAFTIALKHKNISATDDCGMVKTFLPNEAIGTVEGERENFKITFEDDLHAFKKALKSL